MKYILILILSTSILFAKAKDICFTAQVQSFTKKNSPPNSLDYPESCILIEYKKINTIRCGCFDKYKDVKKYKKELLKSYPATIIVSTYKYRFTTKRAAPEPIAVATKKVQKEEDYFEEEQSSEEDLFDDEIQESNLIVQGNINLTSQYYLIAPEDKNPDNLTVSTNLEMLYHKNNFKAKAKFRIQQDSYDTKNDSQRTDRSFMRLDELYVQTDLENDLIMFGKNVRFWGALEVRNITDSFNPDELRSDPFYKDKLGVWNATLSHYTDNGEFSAIFKFNEQSRKMSGYPYVYYYFPQDINTLPLEYNNELLSDDSLNRPSIYLKYAASTDTEYALDYAIIFENGYDSQRYYTRTLASDGLSVTTNENVYLVNKLLTYNTLVVGSTLIKLEAVYTDVIDNDEISDYVHLGLGVEHTIAQVFRDADLGLIGEYYNYTTLESGKRNDLQLFELFQNDLFLGLRYSFNQGNDATIVTGAILDLDYNEQVYYLEYSSRIAEIFKVNFDFRHIEPAEDKPTAFNLMGRHERLSLKVGYYF